MFAAARQNDVMLLEAFPYYFQPQTGVMLELLHRGEVGQVRSVQASFGFTLSKPKGNIRLNPEIGRRGPARCRLLCLEPDSVGHGCGAAEGHG